MDLGEIKGTRQGINFPRIVNLGFGERVKVSVLTKLWYKEVTSGLILR